MAFERNDIVNKTRLAGELGEELMGFEHNDIVTTYAMDKAIAEGGGGGGGETITWLIEDVAVEAEYNDVYDAEGAFFDFSDVLDEATFVSTFSGKTLVSVLNGVKVEAPGYVAHDDDHPDYDQVNIFVGFDDAGSAVTVLLAKSDMGVFISATAGTTITWSLGIVEE